LEILSVCFFGLKVYKFKATPVDARLAVAAGEIDEQAGFAKMLCKDHMQLQVPTAS